MPTGLDVSLDDITRKSGRPNEQRAVGLSASGPPDRRQPNRQPIRPNPYPVPQPAQVAQRMCPPQQESGTKLYISNLDLAVSKDDIKLLFSEVGELKTYSIHYDERGSSKGTAEVVFCRKADALASISRYNNMQLDGRPIKIELVGVDLAVPTHFPPSNSIFGTPRGILSRLERVNAVRAQGHSSRGSGQIRNHGEKVSVDGGHNRKYGEKVSVDGGHNRKYGEKVSVDDGHIRNHGRIVSVDGGQVKKHGKRVTAEDLDAELDEYRKKLKKKRSA